MSTDPHGRPVYNQPQNQPGYAPGDGQNYAEGSKHAQLSLVFGVVGLFFLGIVFGPLAIVQAKKAEQLGVSATAGKVLGWISLIWGVLAIMLFIAFAGAIISWMSYSP